MFSARSDCYSGFAVITDQFYRFADEFDLGAHSVLFWRALDSLMASWKQVAELHCHVARLDKTSARAATGEDLTALGLNARELRLPGALSGGMSQRVAFAAAAADGAPILLADEPTKGLDQ